VFIKNKVSRNERIALSVIMNR